MRTGVKVCPDYDLRKAVKGGLSRINFEFRTSSGYQGVQQAESTARRFFGMETIREELNTQVRAACQVLVAGGGVAGIAAALAAARGGADVLLVEKEFMPGGLSTLGLVTIYLPLCDGMGNQLSFGIAEELLKLSVRYGAAGPLPEAWLRDSTIEERKKQRYVVDFNPHLFALAAEELLRKSGVRILYGTTVASVHKKGRNIDAVIVENKSGRYAIEVKGSVIDCTGDADVCKMSGEDTALHGRGNLLAAWYYATDGEKVRLYPLGTCDKAEEDKTGQEEQPLTVRRFLGVDGQELSEMMLLSHDKTLAHILLNRKQYPAYMPVCLPTIPQVRMTRRLNGRYVMDVTEMHKHFADSVGKFGDWRKRGPAYELPFSVLTGKKVDNLLCAGRCISVTDEMWDVTRVIPVCAVSGEAAGTAAAMFSDFSNADIARLQSRLTENGVRL